MRVSLVDEPPATLAVLSEINSLCSSQHPVLCSSDPSIAGDVRLELGELGSELVLGLVPELGGLLRWL